MKNHTNIEQSKKLAEILPIESADMWWPYYYDVVSDTGEYDKEPMLHKPISNTEHTIPCWSLAALLNVLPSDIRRHGKTMFMTLEKAGAYNLYYKSKDRLDELWETDFEPIDACYKMILDLQELKISSK